MQRITFGRLALWVSLGVFILGFPLLRRMRRARWSGMSRDAGGAVIPNANVTVINVDTREAKNVDDQPGRRLHGSAASARQLSGDGLG